MAIKRRYAKDYPHMVGLPGRPGGYERELDAIYAWSRERCPDHRSIGGTFLFRTEDEADAFRRTWLRT